MLMMKIELDAGKIQNEGRYDVCAMCRTIESAFTQMGLLKGEATAGELVYTGSGNARDYGRFGKVVNTLKKQPWFMENVSLWRMYDSDDADNPNDFDEEDLLLHYRARRVGA